MITLTTLLLVAPGLRIGVVGEGRLRLVAGNAVSYVTTATLVPNAQGLLADSTGRVVVPQIHVSGPFAVSLNGTVTVSGNYAGRLFLQSANGQFGLPGEGAFGLIQTLTGGAKTPTVRSAAAPSSPLTHGGQTTITVRPRSEVDGDRILLRDIASLSGDRDAVARLKEVDLGEAPVLGTRRSISRWNVLSVLREAGFKEKEVTVVVSPDTTVARKGQTVEPRTITDAATEAARKEFGNVDLAATMGPAPILAPQGDLSLETSSMISGEHLIMTVTAMVDGHSVADRKIGFVVKPTGVRSGQAVRVLVSRNGAVLEMDAKAKTSGKLGETIQIETEGGATLSAVVTGPGQVEVQL